MTGAIASLDARVRGGIGCSEIGGEGAVIGVCATTADAGDDVDVGGKTASDD